MSGFSCAKYVIAHLRESRTSQRPKLQSHCVTLNVDLHCPCTNEADDKNGSVQATITQINALWFKLVNLQALTQVRAHIWSGLLGMKTYATLPAIATRMKVTIIATPDIAIEATVVVSNRTGGEGGPRLQVS